MSDAVFIALITAITLVIVAALLLLLKMLRPKNISSVENHGGVDLSGGYSLTGSAYDKHGYHTGTLVMKNGSKRLKVTIMDLDTGEETVANIQSFLTIGRNPSDDHNDPNVYTIKNDTLVSGKHCRLLNYSGSLALEDVGSTNHTYLNGVEVSGVVYVNDGDVLELGHTRLLIRESRG